MAHLPGTPHTMKCAVLWTFGSYGMVCANTFYLMDPSDAIFTAPDTTAAGIATDYVAQVMPHQYASITFNGVDVEDVRTPVFGGIHHAVSPGVAGSIAGTSSVPSSVALAIRKQTASFGRSNRGRWYWPLADVSTLVTGDTVSAAVITAAQNALAAFQTALQTRFTGTEMGIVSYQTGNTPRTAGLFQQITGWAATDAFVDSQRRRLVGRGK